MKKSRLLHKLTATSALLSAKMIIFASSNIKKGKT